MTAGRCSPYFCAQRSGRLRRICAGGRPRSRLLRPRLLRLLKIRPRYAYPVRYPQTRPPYPYPGGSARCAFGRDRHFKAPYLGCLCLPASFRFSGLFKGRPPIGLHDAAGSLQSSLTVLKTDWLKLLSSVLPR